jgi:hypothetical protein
MLIGNSQTAINRQVSICEKLVSIREKLFNAFSSFTSCFFFSLFPLLHVRLAQRFTNLVLGTPRGAHLDFCPNTTQLTQSLMISSASAKTKTCTPWGPKDRVWETLALLLPSILILIWIWHVLTVAVERCRQCFSLLTVMDYNVTLQWKIAACFWLISTNILAAIRCLKWLLVLQRTENEKVLSNQPCINCRTPYIYSGYETRTIIIQLPGCLLYVALFNYLTR